MRPNYISIADRFGLEQGYTVPQVQQPCVWSKDEVAGTALELNTRDLEAV